MPQLITEMPTNELLWALSASERDVGCDSQGAIALRDELAKRIDSTTAAKGPAKSSQTASRDAQPGPEGHEPFPPERKSDAG
jgi:hypothetical protein